MFITFTRPKLLELDLPVLIEMLTSLTMEYSEVAKSDGTSSRASVLKEYISNLQSVIEVKKAMQKIPFRTGN
jgi:hypothetical protein